MIGRTLPRLGMRSAKTKRRKTNMRKDHQQMEECVTHAQLRRSFVVKSVFTVSCGSQRVDVTRIFVMRSLDSAG